MSDPAGCVQEVERLTKALGRMDEKLKAQSASLASLEGEIGRVREFFNHIRPTLKHCGCSLCAENLEHIDKFFLSRPPVVLKGKG